MGWLEDLGNLVASGVAVVADTVETVVETAGRDIEEGARAESCQTPNRTDQCCILVKRADEQR